MSREWVSLSKKTVVITYCLLEQAASSVHRSKVWDENGWNELCAYYSGERGEQLQNLIIQFREICTGDMANSVLTREQLESRFPNWLFSSEPIFAILARFKHSFRFRVDEICFILHTLEQMMNLIREGGNPPVEKRAPLRWDLSSGVLIIRVRSCFTPELKVGDQIEYYQRASTRPGYTLEQIVSKLSL